MRFIKPSFKILKGYYRNPAVNLKLVLANELDKIKRDDRQAVTRVVYGVVRKERLLDYIIQTVSKRKLKKIQPDIRLLLRMGVFLLIYSQSYPDYAVVNEVVDAVAGKAKGFVNALLRNIIKRKKTIIETIENSDQLDLKYSVSRLLIDNLPNISDNIEEHLEYLNREPLFHIRVNTGEGNYSEAKQLLTENQVAFRELEKFCSFEIKETGAVINRLLEKKQFYFQNTASQLVSIIASKFSKQAVLDCCAAPGTKSVTLSLLNPDLTVYANDINPKRAKLLKDFLTGYHLTAIKPVVSDIKNICFKKDFDFIIVDASCTSSGTLRKNPDLKLKIDNDLVSKNAKEQHEIMETLMNYFSNTGSDVYILYSVCSFIKAETEDIMEKVLKIDNVETVDLEALLEEYGFNYKKGDYGYYLLPNDTLNNDMFYLVLFRCAAL